MNEKRTLTTSTNGIKRSIIRSSQRNRKQESIFNLQTFLITLILIVVALILLLPFLSTFTKSDHSLRVLTSVTNLHYSDVKMPQISYQTFINNSDELDTSPPNATVTSEPLVLDNSYRRTSPISPTTTSTGTTIKESALPTCDTDLSCKQWHQKLLNKLLCLSHSCGLIYLYHVRKAAGTNLRYRLTMASPQQRVQFLESEGLNVYKPFLNMPGLLSTISFRDPIERIISLYWYEHVVYYYKVQKTPGKASNLLTWVNTWRDSSAFKQDFIHKNPGNVYVEVENYYVKLLSGWTGTHTLTDSDLEAAKEVLRQFDIVIISEWINNSTHQLLFQLIDPTASSPPAASQILQTDRTLIQSLNASLASDEAEVRELLIQLNQYDIQLYTYAKELVTQRMPTVSAIVTNRPKTTTSNSTSYMPRPLTNAKYLQALRVASVQCMSYPTCSVPITQSMLKQYTGFFRPVGHKSPVNESYIEPTILPTTALPPTVLSSAVMDMHPTGRLVSRDKRYVGRSLN